MEDFWDYKVVIWKFVVVDVMGFILISMLFLFFGGVLLVFVSFFDEFILGGVIGGVID